MELASGSASPAAGLAAGREWEAGTDRPLQNQAPAELTVPLGSTGCQQRAFTEKMKKSENTNKRKLCSVEPRRSAGEEKQAVSGEPVRQRAGIRRRGSVNLISFTRV